MLEPTSTLWGLLEEENTREEESNLDDLGCDLWKVTSVAPERRVNADLSHRLEMSGPFPTCYTVFIFCRALMMGKSWGCLKIIYFSSASFARFKNSRIETHIQSTSSSKQSNSTTINRPESSRCNSNSQFFSPS